MPVVIENGILISTKSEIPASLDSAFPDPQIDIQRSPQEEDAWCYAACAEMVINKLQPERVVTQCAIASFIKDSLVPSSTHCCSSFPRPEDCTDSGCTKDEIGRIFVNFGVDYEGSDPDDPFEIDALSPTQIVDDISADHPIEAVIDWFDDGDTQSSHAVLIVGFNGNSVYVIDPLRGLNYNGWQPYNFVVNGFGHGKWVRTWRRLRSK